MSDIGSTAGGGRWYPLAPMDRMFQVMTWVLLVLMAVLAGGFAIAAAREPEAWVGIPVTLFIALVIAGVWCYARPSGFELTSDRLCIRFPLRTREVPLSDVVQGGRITKDEVGFVLRLCGAGGLWGGFGLMWSRNVGKFDAYISSLHAMVRIDRRDARPLVISPADPDAFVRELQSRLG